jgi:hypothetical protein
MSVLFENLASGRTKIELYSSHAANDRINGGFYAAKRRTNRPSGGPSGRNVFNALVRCRVTRSVLRNPMLSAYYREARNHRSNR